MSHSDWIDFLNENDGAVPEPNEFDIGLDDSAGVSSFYGVEEAREGGDPRDERNDHKIRYATTQDA